MWTCVRERERIVLGLNRIASGRLALNMGFQPPSLWPKSHKILGLNHSFYFSLLAFVLARTWADRLHGIILGFLSPYLSA